MTKRPSAATVVLSDIIADIERQLEWRGPNGHPLGHVVFERPQAEMLLQKLYDVQLQDR